MREILDSLASPVWWFTTVVVGALVGLLGSYLQNAISKFAASYSTKAAQRREGAARQRGKLISELASSSQYLIVYSTEALLVWLFTSVTYIASLLLPIWTFAMNAPELRTGVLLVDPIGPPRAAGYLSTILSIMACVFIYHANKRLVVLRDVRSRLREPTEAALPNSDVAADEALGRCAPSGPRS